MNMTTVNEGVVYLEVTQGRYYGQLRVVKATNKRPRVTTEGSVIVKLTLQIPRVAFAPLSPEATVVIPADRVQHPVTVEATEP